MNENMIYVRKSLAFLGWIFILMHAAVMASATDDLEENLCPTESPICCIELPSGPIFCVFYDKEFIDIYNPPIPDPDPGPYLPGIGLDSIESGQPVVVASSGSREDWLTLSESLFDPHSSWVFKDDYIMPGVCERLSDFSNSAVNYTRFIPNSSYCGYYLQEDSTVIAIQAKTQSRPTEPFTDLEVFSYRHRWRGE